MRVVASPVHDDVDDAGLALQLIDSRSGAIGEYLVACSTTAELHGLGCESHPPARVLLAIPELSRPFQWPSNM